MLRHLAFFTFLRGAATEGGRGHAVATTAWQSTQHLPSDYVPSAGRASVNCSRFVVITSQRSGSRYFMDKLKSHASIRTAGEIFSHDRYKNTSWSAMHSEINRHMSVACAYHRATTVGFRVVPAPAPAPSPRPTTTTRAKGMTYFQRLAAEAEAARQARLERLKAEARAAEEAGALGLKSEGD